MFRAPAVLSALALCAVYAVGCRLVRRPWLVLAAVAALAFSLPQLNVARETFSEPAVEILLWAGMWLILVAFERRALGVALLAGGVLAGTMLSRIDAPVYLIPLPILAALAWLSAKSAAERRWLARMFGVVVLGAVPVALLGSVDVVKLAGTYYDDLHTPVHEIQVGFTASLVFAIFLVICWPYARSRLSGMWGWLGAHRSSIAAGAGIAVALLFLAAWAVRPALMHPRTIHSQFIADLQQAAGLPIDSGRTYVEDSVVWLSWYLGPITLALAAVGAALAMSRIIRRPNPTYLVVLFTAGIGTAVYIWNPSIGPDQIWAMRRFVPAAMPLLVLLAALAISSIASLVARQAGRAGSAAVLTVGTAAMVAFPIGTTIPVGGFQPQKGVSAAIAASCRAMGPKAAIVIAYADDTAEQYMSALRSWCNVPIAMLAQRFSAAQMTQLASAWKDEGRTLWVVGSTPALVRASAPGLTPALLATVTTHKDLEMTINRPPSHYGGARTDIYGSPVTP
jgi:hypothetical protein